MSKMNWNRLRGRDRMRRDVREDMSTDRMLWLLEYDPDAPPRRYVGKRERAAMHRLGQEWLARRKKPGRPSIDDINLLLAEARRREPASKVSLAPLPWDKRPVEKYFRPLAAATRKPAQ